MSTSTSTSASASARKRSASQISAPAPPPSPQPVRKTVSQRLDAYAETLDPLDASRFATATSEPFYLIDMLGESLEELVDECDEPAFASILDRGLTDAEFSVTRDDFEPLMKAMRNLEAEQTTLVLKLKDRLVEYVGVSSGKKSDAGADDGDDDDDDDDD